MSKFAIAGILSLLSFNAYGDYFCKSVTNRTWLIISDKKFSIIQDQTQVIRTGVISKIECKEGEVTRCYLASPEGEVARIAIEGKNFGNIFYRQDGEEYMITVSCPLHPHKKKSQ